MQLLLSIFSYTINLFKHQNQVRHVSEVLFNPIRLQRPQIRRPHFAHSFPIIDLFLLFDDLPHLLLHLRGADQNERPRFGVRPAGRGSCNRPMNSSRELIKTFSYRLSWWCCALSQRGTSLCWSDAHFCVSSLIHRIQTRSLVIRRRRAAWNVVERAADLDRVLAGSSRRSHSHSPNPPRLFRNKL